MPTVLEVLRTHLLGDEAANALEQFVVTLDARLAQMPVAKVPAGSQFNWPDVPLNERVSAIVEAMRTPSLGLELLLIADGWNPLIARAAAKIVVHRGLRCADESNKERAG